MIQLDFKNIVFDGVDKKESRKHKESMVGSTKPARWMTCIALQLSLLYSNTQNSTLFPWNIRYLLFTLSSMILFDFLLSKDRLNGRCLRYGQYQRLDEKGANSKLKGEGGRERLLIVEQSAIEDTYQASINSTFIKNEAFPNTSTYPSVSTTLKQFAATRF